MALITPPATWLTGTKSDTDTLAATYAAPEAVDALAAMSTDNPATEAQFRPSVMTPERIATAERMRDDHQSWESIGRVLGVGASSVRRALALTDARKDRSGERSKHLG